MEQPRGCSAEESSPRLQAVTRWASGRRHWPVNVPVRRHGASPASRKHGAACGAEGAQTLASALLQLLQGCQNDVPTNRRMYVQVRALRLKHSTAPAYRCVPSALDDSEPPQTQHQRSRKTTTTTSWLRTVLLRAVRAVSWPSYYPSLTGSASSYMAHTTSSEPFRSPGRVLFSRADSPPHHHPRHLHHLPGCRRLLHFRAAA